MCSALTQAFGACAARFDIHVSIVSSDFTVTALRWSGVPVYREALDLVIPTGRWSVVAPGSGWTLYARAAEFADCRSFTPPPGTAALCDRTPPSRRQGPGYYLWLGGPAHAAFGLPDAHDHQVRAFAIAAIIHQPLDFLGVAGTDLVRYVVPDFGRIRSEDYVGPDGVAFPPGKPGQDPQARQAASAYYGPVHPQPTGAAEGLRSYQSVMRVAGWELLAFLAIGIGGAFAARGRVRWALILLLGISFQLLLTPALTHAEWRYAVPVEGPIACAAAVGAWLLAERLLARRRLSGQSISE